MNNGPKKKVAFFCDAALYVHIYGTRELKFFGEKVVYCKAGRALCRAHLFFVINVTFFLSVPVENFGTLHLVKILEAQTRFKTMM